MPFNPLSITSLASIRDVPVLNGVNVADVLTTPAARLPVGSLDTQQVTAALAQTARDVNQAADVISADKGVGKFGLTPQQLETAGYLKPGTAAAFLQNPSDIQSVLGNPAVWTGKNNVGDVQKLLGDVNLQSLTQNEVMSGALDSLKQAGALTGTENPAQLASLVQLGSKFGTEDAVSWIKGQAPADLVNSMNEVAKNAQFSVDLVDKAGLDEQVGAAVRGFTSTVNREKIDRAFVAVIGDPKIPIPKFGSDEPDVVGGLAEGFGVARSAFANLPGLPTAGLPGLGDLQKIAGPALSALSASAGSLPNASALAGALSPAGLPTAGLSSALSATIPSASSLTSALSGAVPGLAGLPAAASAALPRLQTALASGQADLLPASINTLTSTVDSVANSVRGGIRASGVRASPAGGGFVDEGIWEGVAGQNVNAVVGVVGMVQTAGTTYSTFPSESEADFPTPPRSAGTFVTKVVGARFPSPAFSEDVEFGAASGEGGGLLDAGIGIFEDLNSRSLAGVIGAVQTARLEPNRPVLPLRTFSEPITAVTTRPTNSPLFPNPRSSGRG